MNDPIDIWFYCWCGTERNSVPLSRISTYISNKFFKLTDSGLYNKISKVYIYLSGVKESQEFYFDELKLIYNKIEFIKDHNPAIGNECDILNKMHDTYLDQDNNHKICYFHTKGFSYNPLPAPIANWIRYSDLHIINHWVERLQELENNDVSGGWLFKPDEETRKFGEPDNRKTFAGHFWWANSSYIKTLEPLTKEIQKGRGEFWLLDNPSVKIYEIDTKLYGFDLHREVRCDESLFSKGW